MDVPAPAKLNLFLHVLGRRDDGYHRLQTVFQLLDWHDTVHVEVRGDSRVCRTKPLANVPEEADLVVRAARALQAHVGERRGADLAVTKRLPMGGGLGGGSSDAAAAIVTLDRLWGLDLPPAELAALGRELGADVPVFVAGRSAWAEGVGEALTPLAIEPCWYAIVHCGVAVSTREVFNDSGLTRNTPPRTIPPLFQGDRVVAAAVVMADSRNDCEPVVVRRHPEIGRALAFLGEGARLTGTGACVYAPFTDPDSARSALAGLPPGWTGQVARGVDASPLHAALRDRGPPDREPSGPEDMGP